MSFQHSKRKYSSVKYDFLTSSKREITRSSNIYNFAVSLYPLLAISEYASMAPPTPIISPNLKPSL